MTLSAKEAATAVGMSKNGIIRAIHTGKLSATRDASGQFEIDPSELFRVYNPVSTAGNSNGKHVLNPSCVSAGGVNGIDDELTVDQSENTFASLSTRVTMLERIIRDKDEVILDLRRRLDTATEECQRLSLIVTSQLVPTREGLAPAAPRPGFWRRLLG